MYEVRRTGDGKYHIVLMNDKGHTEKNYYDGNNLVTFDEVDEAKEFARSLNETQKVRGKKLWQLGKN